MTGRATTDAIKKSKGFSAEIGLPNNIDLHSVPWESKKVKNPRT